MAKKFTDALVEYVQKNKNDAVWRGEETLWTHIDSIFDTLRANINADDKSIDIMCTYIYPGDGKEFCISECHKIMNILYFMNGYSYTNRQWIAREHNNSEMEDVEHYIRCWAGGIALGQLYDRDSAYSHMVQRAAGHLEIENRTNKDQFKYGKCRNYSYAEIVTGLKFIAATMKNRMEDWEDGGLGARGTLKEVATCKSQGPRGMSAWAKNHGIIKALNDNSAEDIQKIITESNNDTREELDNIFKGIDATTNNSKLNTAVQHDIETIGTKPPKPRNTTAAATDLVTAAIACDRDMWDKIKTVLYSFIDHMERIEEHVQLYGANCFNAGWEPYQGSHNAGQSVANVIRCAIMTGALLFMANGNHIGPRINGGTALSKDEESELKCMVINVFEELLKEMECGKRSTRGLMYARYTMKKMEDLLGKENPLTKGTCDYGQYNTKYAKEGFKLSVIRSGLIGNTHVIQRMRTPGNPAVCNKPWAEYRAKWTKGNDEDDDTWNQRVLLKAMKEEKIIEAVKGVVQEIKEEVKRVDDMLKAGHQTVQPAAATPASEPKPVAATLASPPSSGSGTTSTTTTSSGGGGGKAGYGAAEGGEKGKKAGTDDDCDWKSIEDENRREIVVMPPHGTDELKKTKSVLDEFMNYMDQDNWEMDAMGANCHNTGWDDVDKKLRRDQTVADVMRCRLMSGALFFANGGNRSDINAQGKTGVIDDLEERLKCDMYCGDKKGFKRGIEYAWKTMNEMNSSKYGGTTTMTGPVFEGRCTMCGYNIPGGPFRIRNGDMVTWFLQEGQIMNKIGVIQGKAHCNTLWTDYTQRMGITLGDVQIEDKITEVKETEKTIRNKTKEAFENIKELVEQKIKEEEKTGKHTEHTKNKNTNIRPNTTTPAHEYEDTLATDTTAHGCRHNNTHTRWNSASCSLPQFAAPTSVER
ncbi:hypothetical protein AK88_04730 [Plasmodium fragile]|uniref:Schizont-infected cell agglutination extracellular alpha domain-containing protein n=1 Tax=Plasmodium fragile TaxID=5857 RepID=A0A0D9QFP4_PLAFR|nr:uncharacterized protein AK88_04730 [Plasmodium fragile]KJP85617.1 hypothetical protein AK88_04730 [Plasmodium fragile]